MASVRGLVAWPHKAAYVSAKHGVIGLVKTLALEGADEGMKAVAACPAYARSRWSRARLFLGLIRRRG
jgi:3-hydroxybutyrate dehydrogenase